MSKVNYLKRLIKPLKVRFVRTMISFDSKDNNSQSHLINNPQGQGCYQTKHRNHYYINKKRL